MKILEIMIVMLVLIMSVGAVCAAENISDDVMGSDSQNILENVPEDIASDDGLDILKATQGDICTAGEASFTNLTDEIENAGDALDLTQDYKFNNGTDNRTGILIAKDNFTVNGNGRTIDANNQSRIFNITANNVTLNNLILINGNADKGGAIYSYGTLTLNNVTFINNYATENGGAVGLPFNVTLNCNNSRFIDNYADTGSAIYVGLDQLYIYNTQLSSKMINRYSQIAAFYSKVHAENLTFINSTSLYASAFYLESCEASIIRTRFINLKANITAGAIGIKYNSIVGIKNCEFLNVTSSKNGGAIFASLSYDGPGKMGQVTISDSVFKDTSSGFGGACLLLHGGVNLWNSEFINTHATYNGGSVYISLADCYIHNCTFDSNYVELIDDYPTYGGAIYSDYSKLYIRQNSKFFNNHASAGSAVFLYDPLDYEIKDSIFINNTNPIYSVGNSATIHIIDKSNVFINDSNISTNNKYFKTIMSGQGIQLTLLNNSINVTAIPPSFDLREYNWTSPVRNQGRMGACWTFSMTGVLESALLKAAGITTDFSENNMQNTMLVYSIYGNNQMDEGGGSTDALAYLLSWLGAFTQDADIYDELGKISPVITTELDFHVQDAMFIPNNEIPNGTQLKLAIMKYGSIDGAILYDKAYYNQDTCAYYVYPKIDTPPNHAVSIVGWDDSFPKEKFLVEPPADGAWIVKNSWGSEWGDNGYFYISYYDKKLWQYYAGEVAGDAVAIIIENTEPYNKNYQYDMDWNGVFLKGKGKASYYNVYESIGDDLIAAVGTYFNQSGVDYKIEIFVNDELKLTQTGVSPYFGYHTIKLNEYIPVKKGDIFKAKVTSNNIPVLEEELSRVIYSKNLSFISTDGVKWKDGHTEGKIACLKVYTVAYPTFSELERKIANSTGNYLKLDVDYKFNETDNNTGILISIDNFVLDGNGHILDADNQSRIFNITGNNITLSNLILINGNSEKGGAIYSTGSLTLNNVTFIDNHATEEGGALYGEGFAKYCRFIDNSARNGGATYQMTADNCNFTNNNATEYGGAMYGGHASNCIFTNNHAGNSGDDAYNTVFPKAVLTVSNFTSSYNSGVRLFVNFTDDGGIAITNAIVTVRVYKNNALAGNYRFISGEGWKVTLGAGAYNAVFSVEHQAYDTGSANATLAVSKASTALSASAVSTFYNVNKNLVVTIKSNNKALSGKKVTVKVGTISKTLTTNSKGQVSVDISTLVPKAYTATVKFAGDTNYKASSKSVKVTVKKATPKVAAAAKAFKVKDKTKKYVVTMKTNKNKALKNVIVYIKVNGKTYSAKTNSKGQATFKLTKLNKVGKFNAAVTFKGNKYYNKVTKKVNIKIK